MKDIPWHLTVGEPELKWCEALIEEFCWSNHWYSDPKIVLMTHTNLSEPRIDRAINLLRTQKRI